MSMECDEESIEESTTLSSTEFTCVLWRYQVDLAMKIGYLVYVSEILDINIMCIRYNSHWLLGYAISKGNMVGLYTAAPPSSN